MLEDGQELTLMLKREDLKECTSCHVPFPPETKLLGYLNPFGSNFESENGWLLGIKHIRNSIWGEPDHDEIHQLTCPVCTKRMSDAFLALLDEELKVED